MGFCDFLYKRGENMLVSLIAVLMQLIFVMIILVAIGKGLKRSGRKSSGAFGRAKKASAVPNQSRTRTVPNIPKKYQRTKSEEAMQTRTRASRAACDYKAAYSKGRPDRIGLRGDYEPLVPAGKERIRCAYCGAENFVPMGTHEHYHCYFCWEKL